MANAEVVAERAARAARHHAGKALDPDHFVGFNKYGTPFFGVTEEELEIPLPEAMRCGRAALDGVIR